jgi:hypothetical protein
MTGNPSIRAGGPRVAVGGIDVAVGVVVGGTGVAVGVAVGGTDVAVEGSAVGELSVGELSVGELSVGELSVGDVVGARASSPLAVASAGGVDSFGSAALLAASGLLGCSVAARASPVSWTCGCSNRYQLKAAATRTISHGPNLSWGGGEVRRILSGSFRKLVGSRTSGCSPHVQTGSKQTCSIHDLWGNCNPGGRRGSTSRWGQVFGSIPHLVKASTKDGGTNWQQVFGALP